VLEISLNPGKSRVMQQTWQVCPRHVDYSDATFRQSVGF